MTSIDRGPRSAQLRRIKHHVDEQKPFDNLPLLFDQDPSQPPPLVAGNMRLFSYYSPSLRDDKYSIRVQQSIVINRVDTSSGKVQPTEEHKELVSVQSFEVVGPRFSLPAGAIHQVYPPQGHGDHHMVLPHMVFNDPHLPWERLGSTKDGSQGGQPSDLRARVPWLALLTFSGEELKLSSEELGSSPTGLFPTKPMTQSSTSLAVNLPLSDVLQFNALGKVITPVMPLSTEEGVPVDQPVDMVFLRPELFKALFASYTPGSDGMAQGQRYWNGTPDVTRYRYMSHVREINNASAVDVGLNDVGTYSVVVSHRGGPLPGDRRVLQTGLAGGKAGTPTTFGTNTLPTPVQVHLISLLDVEQLNFDDAKPPNRVGLVSLHSWTYICLPPDDVSFLNQMRAIGSQIPADSWLRPPEWITQAIQMGDQTQRLQDRLKDGYTVIKWKTKTGEDTLALNRGPLLPTLSPSPISVDPSWPKQVNHSSALNILDAKLGIMDMSYASAWELGRTLAIADRAFTAALVRLRRSATLKGSQESLKSAIGKDFRGYHQVLTDLVDSVKQLRDLAQERTPPMSRDTGSTPRVDRGDVEYRIEYHRMVQTAVASLASTPRGLLAADTSATSGTVPYNEVNVPASSDWALVMKWIIDKLYLYNIPAHYLLTNPTNLPEESIRFFYIDTNWLDWLVDGALSIGNHLDSDYDSVREAIKAQMNQYFGNAIHDKSWPYRPQIPTFGFLLRSKIVEKTPDLRVRCPWPDPKDLRSEILRNDRLTTDLLFCLLDRSPGSGEFVDDANALTSGIEISQPPHQQRYTAGVQNGIDKDTSKNRIEVEFRKVFTAPDVPSQDRNSMTLDNRCWEEGTGEILEYTASSDRLNPYAAPPTHVKALVPPNPKAIFDWDLGALIPEQFAMACNNILQQELGIDKYQDSEPNAACVGIQLNDPMLKLVIRTPSPQTPLPTPTYRQFPLDLLPSSTPTPRASSTVRTPMLSRPPAGSPQADLPQVLPWTIDIVAIGPASETAIFDYHFYPCGKLLAENGTRLSIAANSLRTDIPVDLLVRIVRKGDAKPVKLRKVMLQFPISDTTESLPLIKPFHNFTGWGAGMVNNHRFNVVTTSDATASMLQCDLFPRSPKVNIGVQQLDTADVPELTFVLNGTSLHPKILDVGRTYSVFATEEIEDGAGSRTLLTELRVTISTV